MRRDRPRRLFAPRSHELVKFLATFDCQRLPFGQIEFRLNMHRFFVSKIEIASITRLVKLQRCFSRCRRSFLDLNSKVAQLQITLMFVKRDAHFRRRFQDFISDARLRRLQLRFRGTFS